MNAANSKPGPITLQVPASGANAGVVRMVAATLATHLDYTVDRLDDLRLITGEFFSLVMELAQPADSVRLHFAILDNGVKQRIHLHSRGTTVRTHSLQDGDLRWTLLTALANDVRLQVENGKYTVDTEVAAETPLPRPDD